MSAIIPDAEGFFAEALSSDEAWRAVHLLAFLPGHSPERDAISIALRTDQP